MVQGLLRPLNLTFILLLVSSNLLSSLICDDPGPAQATPSPHSSQTPSSLLSSLISCDLGLPEAYLPHQHLHPPPGILQPLIQPDLL
ncbi:hypothetical protein GG344DRAFT_84323 [Lentinula edodes]|nr:hypothetical protein GG344DRAFT_84323 [Lentinula edodes]